MRPKLSANKPYLAEGRAPNTGARYISVGMSNHGDCGVRDYAAVSEAELARLGYEVERVWLERPAGRGWLPGLAADAALLAGSIRAIRREPRPVLFHYNPFSFGAHGMPMLAALLPLAARASGGRTCTFFHELCYPLQGGSLREWLWAIWQRAVLVPLVLGSSTMVVTSDDRREWLASKFRVRPDRLTKVVVGSNIPVIEPQDSSSPRKVGEERVIGSFGWGIPTAAVEVVLDALAILQSENLSLRFVLIGSPGPDSDQGRRWLRAARARGVESALIFTGGGLSPQEVSRHLSALEAFIHIDPAGPTSRRTSLAAALAHAKPVICFEGSENWQDLHAGVEILMARGEPKALAASIKQLLASDEMRRSLSVAAAGFYNREMNAAETARRLGLVIVNGSQGMRSNGSHDSRVRSSAP